MKQQKITMPFNIKTMLCVLSLTMLFSFEASAQKERRFVREGNKEYEKGNFDAAQTSYLKALNIDSTSYEALFNLSDALYQQKNYDEALKISQGLSADSLQNDERTAYNFYNMGNIYFQKKEYQKAIDEYKKSLRIRPDDYEAKFNLAYAQMMLQNQQNQQDQQQQDQDKNQDKDKDKEQDKQDQQDQNKDNKDQNQDNKDNKDKGQPQEPKEGEMSKKEAEQILKAMQNNENKTQEKVKDQTGTPVNLRGRKNW